MSLEALLMDDLFVCTYYSKPCPVPWTRRSSCVLAVLRQAY